jgi:tetratricopeptide (TPR) repeat protein
VNVRVGQEFHVYHPDFTGQKGFFYSDGRSKKRLGTYPRVSSGRLVVFDVQLEISFCTVADKSLERFPTGSVLEQIPLGSIYHLVSAEVRASVVGAGEVAELEKYAEGVLKRGAQPIAAVFFLRNMAALEKARGTAFVNRALATLSEEVRRGFPLPARMCLIESDKIAVVAQIDAKSRWRELAQSVIDDGSKKMSNLVEFAVGVFAVTTTDAEKLEGDQSTFDPKKALSYARYAAVSLEREEKQVEFFTPQTAARIIRGHRLQKTQAEALVDYQALHDLGIEYSLFENQAALCALELGKEDFALAHMQRAITLDSNVPILKANLAYIQFVFKQPLQAHETFTRLRKDHPGFASDNVYVGPEALVAYTAYRKDPKTTDLPALKALLENALKVAVSGGTEGQERLGAALTEISSLMARTDAPQAEPTAVLDVESIWTSLLEAVGRASPFTRTYLLEAHPVSFDNGTFIIGFTPEFEDHLGLVDNARNHSLISTKLRELGFEVVGIRFIKN